MKQFNPFDKVLIRPYGLTWKCALYSHKDKRGIHHMVHGDMVNDRNIITYESNEHLINTDGKPEEEITLAEGELIICSNSTIALKEGIGLVSHYSDIRNEGIILKNNTSYYFCIPMSKYNPDNLAETRKWILAVKNGKLVKVNK